MEKTLIERLVDENNEEKLKEELKTHDFEEDSFPILFYALSVGSPITLLKVLIDNGCKRQLKETYDDKSVLQFALSKQVKMDTIRFLITSGADPKSKDPLDESTLLHDCVEQKLPIEYVEYFATYIPVTSVNEYGESALTYALSSEIMDFELLTFLIKEGSDLATKDDYDKTPLHIACEHDVERDLIELMIKKGSNLKAKDHLGKVPLSYLISKKIGKRTLEIFCENGQDLNVKDNFGNTLLHWSCKNNLEIFDFLLESGIDPKLVNTNGENALHLVILNENCQPQHITKLLDFGVDPSVGKKNGETALHHALLQNKVLDEKSLSELITRTELSLFTSTDWNYLNYAITHDCSTPIICLIIEEGLKTHMDFRKDFVSSGLFYACNQKKINPELIAFMLKKGADCSSYDVVDGHPMHYFLYKMHGKIVPFELLQKFYDKRVDLNKKMNRRLNSYTTVNSTILELYIKTHKPKNEIIEWLISNGSTFDNSEENQVDFLYRCCQNDCSLETIQYLVQSGMINPKAKIKKSYSTLHFLALNGKVKQLNYLIEQGADLHSKNGNNDSLLHSAIRGGIETMEFLISKGIEVNHRNQSGNTAFHKVCCEYPTLEKFIFLLKNGADSNIKNYEGILPIHSLLQNSYYLTSGKQKKIHYLEKFRDFGTDFVELDNENENFLSWGIASGDNLETVKFLIENGVRVQTEWRCTEENSLMKAYKKRDRELATLLINFGTDIEEPIESILNTSDDIYSYSWSRFRQYHWKQPENFEHLQSFLCYQQDFGKLYDESLYTDFTINGLKIHKLFVETRLKQKLTKELILKMEKEIKKEHLDEFFRILYSGFRLQEEDKIEKKVDFLESVVKKLQLDEKVLECYRRSSLIKDMKLLLEDEESMDFTICVEDDYIPCHKFVLVARSGLYSEMFQTLNNEIEEVKDYSGKSYETIELLIDYLYTDTIKFTGDNDVEFILEELDDVNSYYQLNKKGSFLKLYDCEMKIFYGEKWKDSKNESTKLIGEAEN
ncbi:ankyrin repeat-containing protein [Anaeramoeba flamelloides]|uniref:Ankyrin repeat-containing protein n=1 Tax=Anaeramoeba flamelloides TaxID=1746091 RepID=A0AAV7YMV3_9EUKA|nr:ankyrin repeat-containing protein [Anaeramoeba flamelloides]